MFLPTTKEELKKLGWENCDIILVTGDTYLDTPQTGAAVIGRVLLEAGYRVGIIAQPDTNSASDITRLGEPRLFWGVTAGAMDSMVANYTAAKKRRKQDDLTPGEMNVLRPDRAVIIYSNLIRRYFKNTRPIVLGGVEASLRRIAHYDFWDDSVRRSVLFDSKADALVYGMGEKAVVELARALKEKTGVTGIRGLCYVSREPVEGYILLPSYEEAAADKNEFIRMFGLFYANNDPVTASGLCQKHGDRYLVQNPPAFSLSPGELDRINELGYEREVHPYYAKQGKVRALETTQFSITAHRGCYGECNFCSIAAHQGNTVVSRSRESILREAAKLARHSEFKGYISDVGGPTANMYGIECEKKTRSGSCSDRRCLYPAICRKLRLSHRKQIELLRELRKVKGIKKIFVTSGLRHDMILGDAEHGEEYLRELLAHHTSGQLKIAPEHTQRGVLENMGKPGRSCLVEFKEMFDSMRNGRQFLTYYLMAAHPGCGEEDMRSLRDFLKETLRARPEQVQVFTPSPSTYSTLMYYCGVNPLSGNKVLSEKNTGKKEKQKRIII